MKVNLKKQFVDFANPNKQQEEIWKLMSVALFNLNHIHGTELNAEQKYAAYLLCRKISEHPESVDITSEEAVMIKNVAAETLSAGAYGQIVDLIEKK